MKNLCIAVFSAIILSLIVVGCIKNNNEILIIDSEIAEARTWLINSGGKHSDEMIHFQEDQRTVTGKLNWNLSKTYIVNGSKIIVVPFSFQGNSTSKNRRILKATSEDDLPKMVNLYLTKENGSYKLAVKISAYEIARDRTNVYTTTFLINSGVVIEQLHDENGRHILRTSSLEVARSSGNSIATDNCQEISYNVTYNVSCTATTMENTTCIYYKREVTRYRCEPTYNEEEVISWIEPDPYGGGTYEYEEEEEELANQRIIDSLQGYPCAQDILSRMPSTNEEVKKILDSVFGISEDVNLVFKPATWLTKDSLINGFTYNPDTVTSDIYYQRIFLNAWVIQNSSQEFIASTMLHESIHAHIDYWYSKYLMGQIDSNTFKNMFPIFWDPSRPRLNTELQQHNEIAANYVEMISRFLQQFNPRIDTTMAKALAWKGLHETTAWKNKSDTSNTVLLYFVARRDVDTSLYNNYGLRKCD